MTPHAAAELTLAPAFDHRAIATDSCLAEAGIVSALLGALNGSGKYRLVDRGGELFLERECQRRPASARRR